MTLREFIEQGATLDGVKAVKGFYNKNTESFGCPYTLTPCDDCKPDKDVANKKHAFRAHCDRDIEETCLYNTVA